MSEHLVDFYVNAILKSAQYPNTTASTQLNVYNNVRTLLIYANAHSYIHIIVETFVGFFHTYPTYLPTYITYIPTYTFSTTLPNEVSIRVRIHANKNTKKLSDIFG